MSRQNAIKALKQMKMEIAADYEMDYEHAFDIIENAHNKGAFSNYLQKLEKKRNAFSGNSNYMDKE